MLLPALAYSRREFALFPVSPTKVPLTTHGHLDATSDATQIKAWWTRHPNANVAARCDWFFVVDFDIGKGGEHILEGWRRVRGSFPRTWTARTGSGGFHYYFEHDAALDAVPLGKLYDGLDIKGGGRGYVLLPPSKSRKGSYRWLLGPTAAPLARAPRWLIDEIVAVKRPREHVRVDVDLAKYDGVDRIERARRYARAIPGAIEGQGGDGATWIAANKVARGFALNEQEAFAVLWTEFNSRCRPPWPEKSLRRVVARALSLGTIPMGDLLDRGAA